MIDLLWIAIISLTVTIALLIAILYNAGKLEFIRWLFKRLKARKKEVIATLAWSTAIALVAIKSYWLSYVNNPILLERRIAWTRIDQWAPRLDYLDFLLILIFSMIAGAYLLDLETILYSSIVTIMLTFIFPIIFSCIFIWYILDYGTMLSNAGGWWVWGEYVVYYALKIILRMIFPLVGIISTIGAFAGAFIRGILKPSSEAKITT